jgi:hypothetical protein
MADSVPAILKSLPLGAIIGGPLEAAIKAQAMAANTTVDFIKQVGLKKDKDGELSAQIVDFKFDRTLEEKQPGANAGDPAITNYRIVPSKLSVPLLSIVPVPFIRIDDMTIDFEYKIHDVETTEHTEEGNIQGKVEVNYFAVKAELSGGYSNKTNNKRETDQSVTMRINVRASQDSIPEGLSRVLDMMHEQLKVVPLESGALVAKPTAKINSIDKSTIKMYSSGTTVNTTAATLKMTGENLDGIALIGSATPEDAAVGLSNLVVNRSTATATEPSVILNITVDVTLGNAVKAGEKTIRFYTDHGIVSAKINVAA